MGALCEVTLSTVAAFHPADELADMDGTGKGRIVVSDAKPCRTFVLRPFVKQALEPWDVDEAPCGCRGFQTFDLRRELRNRGLRNAAESKWENVLEEFWSRDARDSGETDLETYRALDARNAPGVIAMEVA